MRCGQPAFRAGDLEYELNEMAEDLRIFVSSIQKELAPERRAVKELVLGDPVLSKFFSDVFLFEDLPARDRRADKTYLKEAAEREVFIGLMGDKYGTPGADGLSPIEAEFRQATQAHNERLIFLKDDASRREPAMTAFVERACANLTRRRFEDIPALRREVAASLLDYLQEVGRLQVAPFDASPRADLALKDIDAKKIDAFLDAAEAAGRLAPGGSRAPRNVLLHLNLLHEGKLTNAALLLFGRQPEQLGDAAKIQCLHFLGTQKRKPIESQQIFEGTSFQLIDQAREWVLARLARRVGRLEKKGRASVSFEVPSEAIAEALVNAVAHRDYRRPGVTQVELFADRIEVWSPGKLPPGLTPQELRVPHGPIARNSLIADALYRARYSQKAGTGTTDMIEACVAHGLPEPSFEQRGPHFVVTLWREWLTAEVVARLALNDRQSALLPGLKAGLFVTSAAYQRLTGASRQTASRDLDELVRKGLLERLGGGRGTRYSLARGMPRK